MPGWAEKRRPPSTTGAESPANKHTSNDIPRPTIGGTAVGTVTVPIQIGDHQGNRFEELAIIVDTGSTYTAVPRTMLERLGVPIQRSMPSETADGRIVPVDVGETVVVLEGLRFHTPVIFAEANEPILLGVVTLEEAGLAVDPVAGRLIPTHLLRY